MMAKSSKRVVIINNIKSEKIEQAIFILKGSGSQKPDRFIVREAQEIINDYINKVEGAGGGLPLPENINKSKKRRCLNPGVLSFLILTGLLSLIFVIKSFM